MALTTVDILARRLRLAFLNSFSATHVLPRVIHLAGNELGWSPHRRALEFRDAMSFIRTMHAEQPAPRHIWDREVDALTETRRRFAKMFGCSRHEAEHFSFSPQARWIN
eukprot:GABV01007957.1.p1 GENE.GABV01007957.1~~GABV01007957.1.p1  ORF type:complete len:109 (-),score=32.90 GABV01007957.1:91-417(-)